MSLPYPQKTMYQQIRDTGTQHPRLTAWMFLGNSCSYDRFLHRIDRTARSFCAMGIRKGDRVALCLPNCPQAVEALYALNRLGAVAVMIHPQSAPREIQSHMELTGSGVLVTLEPFYARMSKAGGTWTTLLTSFRDVLPGAALHRQPEYPGVLSWRRFWAAGRRVQLPPDTGKSSEGAVILFSGGTTGKAKGVLLTNGNFNSLARQTIASSGISDLAGLRMLSAMPLFHGFGLGTGIHTALTAGACCVLVPKFTSESYARLLVRKKPQIIFGVPTLFNTLLHTKRLEEANLRFLRGVFCGGDYLSPAQKNRIDRFLTAHGASVDVRQGYGLTECITASCLAPEHCDRVGTIGFPFPDTVYGICRPGTTEHLPAGEEGEICLTGPTVMVEYVKDPVETAAVLHRHEDNRIWLHTGDLGTMDADGFVYFTGRRKRIIVTCGYNVCPDQVEAALRSHPAVQECCVIGIADDHRGQRVKAFVVADGVTEEALLDHCRQHIAAYALPREMVFLDKLPRTAIGKPDLQTLQLL